MKFFQRLILERAISIDTVWFTARVSTYLRFGYKDHTVFSFCYIKISIYNSIQISISCQFKHRDRGVGGSIRGCTLTIKKCIIKDNVFDTWQRISSSSSCRLHVLHDTKRPSLAPPRYYAFRSIGISKSLLRRGV